jgi:hypothetical protein
VTVAGAEPQAISEQYEALRDEALAGGAGRRGQGLSLFLTRGLPGWLAALTALGPPPLTRPGAGGPEGPRPPLLPAARAELTRVLAGMVLACAQATEG